MEHQGVWDEVWIPQAAKNGWAVIAADRGKKGLKKGKKLPDLVPNVESRIFFSAKRFTIERDSESS